MSRTPHNLLTGQAPRIPKKRKKYRKRKVNLTPFARFTILDMPDDIQVCIADILRQRRGDYHYREDPQTQGMVLVELLRRQIEAYYGGVEHLPTDQWNAKQYKYRRIKGRSYPAITPTETV